ncbi:MAG: amidohydrolase family protein [Proteobacteria bacterium]|nr:amidohydrolase family protein [Pseudomonadota bacterium]
MSQRASLLIKNLHAWGEAATRDLAVIDGRFAAPQAGLSAERTIDAEGRLAIPGFVEPHIHLDKALILESVRPNASGTLTEAIEIIWERKRRYEVREISQRAGRVIEAAIGNGVTHLRTHVDVDSIGGLRPLEGVARARERYKNFIDVQIVAFPQEGILRDPGCEALMWQAMEHGADVVGGMPFNEASPADSARHIDIAFEIAKKFDADIDMHVDETDDPQARTLEILAERTVGNRWQGRVTAGHTCALSGYDEAYANAVMDKVMAAQLHMIVNPATNLMLQGRLDSQPKRRGITRVRELLERGVNVSFGQDCVSDTFYPFGRNDPLEVALLAAHAAHMSLPAQIEQVFFMPTFAGAKVLRLKGYGLQPGDVADIVIIDAKNAAEAIRRQPPRRWVVKKGRVVAQSSAECRLFV